MPPSTGTPEPASRSGSFSACITGWRTVKAALASAWPAARAPYPNRPSELDPFKPLIDQILTDDLDAPRKQRHTTTRLFDRLSAEHGMTDISYAVVRSYVSEFRKTRRQG